MNDARCEDNGSGSLCHRGPSSCFGAALVITETKERRRERGGREYRKKPDQFHAHIVHGTDRLFSPYLFLLPRLRSPRVSDSPWWSARSRARRRCWCRSRGCRPPSSGLRVARTVFVQARRTLFPVLRSGLQPTPFFLPPSWTSTERDGSSRNTDAARAAPRLRQWRPPVREMIVRGPVTIGMLESIPKPGNVETKLFFA